MAGGKKWQNLLYRKCPLCGEVLEGKKEMVLGNYGVFFNCKTSGCDFSISAQSLAKILRDETHIMRQHLNAEELRLLNRAIN